MLIIVTAVLLTITQHDDGFVLKFKNVSSYMGSIMLLTFSLLFQFPLLVMLHQLRLFMGSKGG